MSVKHKLFSGVLGSSILSIIVAGYSSNMSYRFHPPINYVEPPIAAPDSPATPDPTLKYPIKDRQGDFVTDQNKNPFNLGDPSNVVKSVDYDPASGKYVVTEKIGDQYYRPPTYLSYEEYLKYTEKQERDQYFKNRSNAVNLLEGKNIIPPIQVKQQVFDRLFGGSKIEIRPQGTVEVTLGGNYQKTLNPNIPERNRKTGGFDFNMNINMNVIGKIGDKLQMGIKYNTQSGFDFDNQVKLEYSGQQDDIIKKIELGNVSLPLPTQLIHGSQTLFGIKTQLQFGRLTWTTVLSQQKSKKESLTIENGSLQQNFEIHSDQYEENRHFFLNQYFRDQYDNALSHLPNIRSVNNVTKLEVWITNRNGSTTNVRDVVGLMDLGEYNPYEQAIIHSQGSDSHPDNAANSLYNSLVASPNNRLVDNVVTSLTAEGFQQAQDFEKTYARKLQTNEYTYNAQLGFISLNTALNPNEVLAVAYLYEVNGKHYQVGEFASQVPPDSNATSKVLYLKLLKSTSVRTNLPTWNLMMKNIYNLGAYQISPEDFRLDVYYDDPGGGLKRYIPKGNTKGIPLIKTLNLDNVNSQNDPQPDGLFDFIPGITILPATGRLIFPVKQPFGQNLKAKMVQAGDQSNFADQYTYQQLYDSTRTTAQQFPEFNRFVIKGTYKSSNNREINLGGFNIPKGSVTVTVGGRKLTEGKDFIVEYTTGKVTILDQGILNSGQQIKIDYENNNQFGFQQKNLVGTRLDYRVNNKLNLGATIMHLSERPFTRKVNIGEDPISNTIMGFDFNYQTNAPWLTKALDKLPLYSTKEMSTIKWTGEFAYLHPGHAKSINDPNNGEAQVYLDDFEGTSSGYDLKTPPTVWKLASTPRNSPGKNGHKLFPEADFINDLRYGYNRARLAWYRIDNSFFNSSSSPTSVYANKDDSTGGLANNYVRIIPQTEVFPNRQTANLLDQNIYTFDLAFYPKERGPYNYEASINPTPGVSRGVDPQTGFLKSPETRWGGIMRAIDQNDLEAANIEYIDFWMLDPFIGKPASSGGQLYLNLGNISEDILRDSRMQFENGLDSGSVDKTKWAQVPRLAPLVRAFDNNPDVRNIQDAGFDGYRDAAEQVQFKAFLDQINSGPFAQSVKDSLNSDPSSDNYLYIKDPWYDAHNDASILHRYKFFNGTEGNSPAQSGGSVVTAATNEPDAEDLNKDNSLNEDEEYFQYRIDLNPTTMDVGKNKYIISKVSNPTAQLGVDGDGTNRTVQANTWYQFRIPIRNYDNKVGGIPDFKSIQFMRMFLTGFSDSVVMRFATLEMVRNQWRTYNGDLNDPGLIPPIDNSKGFFNVGKVSLEENGSKTPVNYVIPPNIQREVALGAQTNQFIQQNEQSLAIQACDLEDGDRKAVYKNSTFDLRRYKHLRMYMHANRVAGQTPVKDKEVMGFIRLGSDFKDNYYQYEIPLRITPDGVYNDSTTAEQQIVWPDSNLLEVTLHDFVNAKEQRNAYPNFPKNAPFKIPVGNGRYITVVGNPDIGGVKTFMLGIENPRSTDTTNPLYGHDDRQAKCIEVWFDELRVSGFDEQGGAAATSTVDIKLADLGRIGFSSTMHTVGFGQIEQKVNQRYKDRLWQYAANISLSLGKLLPVNAGASIPFTASISQTFSTPEYDPYQLDIKTTEMLSTFKSASDARAYKATVQTLSTRRDYNFSNVRFVPVTKSKKVHIYDPGNFNFTFIYRDVLKSDPYVQSDFKKNYSAIVAWNFAPQGKDLNPFKKLLSKTPTKWLDIIRDINFNYLPASMGVNTQIDRQFGEIKVRSLGDVDYIIPPTYNKYFKWNRTYNFKYNPFKSLSIDYSANDMARIDEPFGKLDTKEKWDTVWANVKKGGRNTNFTQSLGVNYNVPINKIPILDFITATAGYNSIYTWVAAPQIIDDNTGKLINNTLGNNLTSNQNDKGKIELNMRKLYDKIPFLKTYDTPNPNLGDFKENKKKHDAIEKARQKIQDQITKLKEERIKLKEKLKAAKDDTNLDPVQKKEKIKKLKDDLKTNKKSIKSQREEYRNKQFPSNPGISAVLRPLLAIKKIALDYKETKSTILPGFMGYTRLLGEDYKLKAPGYDFVFGNQPGDRFFGNQSTTAREQWLDNAGKKGWISTDTLLNQKFTQTRTQRIDFTTSIEPFSDLKVDLTMFRDRSNTYQEFFKQTGDMPGVFQHLNPVEFGTYSISYFAGNTIFKKIDNLGFSDTYKTFEDNRSIISKRLGVDNPETLGRPYTNPSDTTHTPNPHYIYGYGPKAQEVLIPAFIAAYTGRNPNTIGLNPFHSFPLPNWRISYNGFTKMKFMQKVFKTFNITHGYSSTLTVGGFQSNVDFQGTSPNKPNRLDTLSGNYYSYYSLPNIVINEQFSPLIGVDMTFINNLMFKFDYKMSRTLSVGFLDYQLVENQSKTITAGFGYKIKGLKLPIKFRGKKIRLDNDLIFKFDFSYRDNIVVNHRIDEPTPQITSGATIISINPSIDYMVTPQLSIRIFTDITKNIPKISTGFPTTNGKGGIMLRFTLAN